MEAPVGTSSKIKSHRDLVVWQKAIELVVNVYGATERFPKAEVYALTSQVRRAVTSIPANIAEGQGRRLSKEYLYFLSNARGSLWELDTHLEVATRVGFLDADQHAKLQNQMDEVGRMLNGLMRSIKASSETNQHPASRI